MQRRRQIGIFPILLVIGLLAVGVYMYKHIVPSSNPVAQTHDAKRKADLSSIQKALSSYYNDHNAYPENDSSYQIVDRVSLLWGSEWTPYFSALPTDPGSNKYVYISDDPGHQTYRLYASMEDWQNDTSLCTPKTNTKCQFAPDNACGGVCNYGVTSPNTSP